MVAAVQLEVSDEVLEETPARALKLIGAIGQNPYVRAALEARGYDEAEHQRGWGLLLGAVGYRPEKAPALAAPEARAALGELDAWDEPNFLVARSALEAAFPAQAAFVFDGLEAAQGAGAVLSVTRFLDRLDELEGAASRKKTRKQDQAALDRLAARGITTAERARLRALLKVALSAPAIEAPAAPDPAKSAARREALVALRGFVVEWSGVARAVVRRRDHLIQLGLAKRKTKKKGEDGQS